MEALTRVSVTALDAERSTLKLSNGDEVRYITEQYQKLGLKPGNPNGSYTQDWLYLDTDYNWRLLPSEGGKLRAVADIGTHWMDTVSFVLGPKISSVFADLGALHKTRSKTPC